MRVMPKAPPAGLPMPCAPWQLRLSNTTRAVYAAHKKGYRVDGAGRVIGLRGRVIRLCPKSPHRSRPAFHVYIADVFPERFASRAGNADRRAAPGSRSGEYVDLALFVAVQQYGIIALEKRVRVAYRNGDPQDCRPNNIVLVPCPAEDRPGLGGTPRRLTPEQVQEVRRWTPHRRGEGESQSALARRLGVTQGLVWRVLAGKAYAWVPAEVAP